jgi:basic amino acid/polyamine antiporter, APA family
VEIKVDKETGLVKGLGLFDSTMIVAGSMIGSGIFIVPAIIANQVNSVWLLFATWIITAFMTITGALSFAELAAAIPKPGGVYIYLKEAYNEIVGFAYGWTLLLVIQTGTIAAVAVATAKFMGVLFPWVNSTTTLINIGNFHFMTTVQFVAIMSLVILTAINITGIKTGAIVQNIFTSAKVLALLSLIIIGLFFVTEPRLGEALTATPIIPEYDNVFLFGFLSVTAVAMVGALFASDAWFDLTFVAGEVKNPGRNLPLALLAGTGLVSILYILVNLAYVNVLGFEGVMTASEDRVGTAAMSYLYGNAGAAIMAIIILVSTIGCNNGLILSGARVFWAMAKDGLFFHSVGTLNKRFHTPAVSLILQCFWASLLCLSGKYNEILDYVITAGLVFYILTIIGVARMRKKMPDLERPYKVYGYPYLPIAYIIFAGFIIFNLLLYAPNYTWPGLIIVLSGVPVYYLWKLLQRKGMVNDDE